MSYAEPSTIHLSCPGLVLGSLCSPCKEADTTEGDLSCPSTNVQNRLDELPLDMSFHLHYENGLDDYSVEDIHHFRWLNEVI